MGTGFTIDTPVRVARYGIHSVMQMDDILTEQMRRAICAEFGEPYEPIAGTDADSRPARLIAYYDTIDRLARAQQASMRAQAFDPGTDLTRYFELLPPGPTRARYLEMRASVNPDARAARARELRGELVLGRLDVNVMTKLDRDRYRGATKLASEWSDASTGLRAFVASSARGAVVFSAGMNPRPYTYAGTFDAFRPGADGALAKEVILKVNDFRSALIQARFLAKRGLWISEFRVESGLNCGGHAFGGEGALLGPVLEQFRREREQLRAQTHEIYAGALKKLGHAVPPAPLPTRVTVQGGIGTAAEDRFLRRRFALDGTGWGTPFLLVPEVTNVDPDTRAALLAAAPGDVWLSDSSPLGIPFWNLRTSASERERLRRIEAGKPGSPCLRGFLGLFNTEFTTKPICLASREYQAAKLEAIDQSGLPEAARAAQRAAVLQKSCICNDLAGGALRNHRVDAAATPAICPGPNIVNFVREATLDEMVDHIYGRRALPMRPGRPNLLIRELQLNLDYLRTRPPAEAEAREVFAANLREGVAFYEGLAEELSPDEAGPFREALDAAARALHALAV